MRVVIVDDDQSMIEQLHTYLIRFQKEKGIPIEIKTYLSPKKFLEEYNSSTDIVLMDIEMDDMDGILAAKKLRQIDQNVVLIFVTNMAQYAIKGYEVDAVDFILKPLSYANFMFRLQKAIRYVEKEKDIKITLKTKIGIYNMLINDIYYVEINLHYLIYHTSLGDLTIRGTIKEAEEILTKYHFTRINNCYLINLKFVRSIEGNTVIINQDALQVSRNRKANFMSEFTRYVGGFE